MAYLRHTDKVYLWLLPDDTIKILLLSKFWPTGLGKSRGSYAIPTQNRRRNCRF